MARVDLSTLDRMYLVGDEDSQVDLGCLDCWRGGKPLAYYDRSPVDDVHRSYAGDTEVTQVDSLAGLVMAAVTHRTSVHGRCAR